MEAAQEREWAEAQKMVLSIDIAAAAKQHLRFLTAVEENGRLYEGPTLQTAINRYNGCWLPLLAKHAETPLTEEPLVVPLDCEWIWHCHRLSPLRYISDCKLLFGRVLDNRNVVSSIEGHSKKQTEEIWTKMYPDVPYDLDFSKEVLEVKPLQGESFTDYDLYSAVQRQRSFYSQVSRPHMSEDDYLQESIARYKAFLYLMKKDMESGSGNFCVPTYDIDLIWHTHQLHPSSYCEDLIQSIGEVVDHDDTDSDRSEGKKLNVGFKGTTQQWEEIFGKKYWRVGALFRGTAADGSGCSGKHSGRCKAVAGSWGSSKHSGRCKAVAGSWGGGKHSGRCKAVAGSWGGGKHSGRCKAVAGSWGGGKHSGRCKAVAGTWGGGKHSGRCKAVAGSWGGGKHSGGCNTVAGSCGGGKCSGKCKAMAGGCGGGKCSGKCKAVAGSCGGGKCSGKCKAAASGCGGGKCSGKCSADLGTDTIACALAKDVVRVINGK